MRPYATNVSHVLRVFYPTNYPIVSTTCRDFPPRHVSLNCFYPGIMVEASFYLCLKIMRK